MNNTKLGAMIAFLLASLNGGLLNQAWSDTITVIQKDKKFNVASIDAKVGDTILFKNEEADITHNVYSLSPGNQFELKVQKPGETTPITLDATAHKPGVMKVECAIHPSMVLTVNVK